MGSNEKFFSTAITVLCLGALILLQCLVSSKDLHREIACYRDRLRINCGDQSFIAIHEAFFTTQVQDEAACGPSIEHEAPLLLPKLGEGEDEATSPTDPTEAGVTNCYEDIRVSINRRCSGSRSCNYSYNDQSEKKCPNLRGQFLVRYDCVKNSSVVKFCNTKLEQKEGYFSSPGFPQFYPYLSQCGWTVSSSPGQSILLKVLHLHLRPPTEVYPTVSDPDSVYALGILGQLVSEEDTKCDVDSLTILEGNVKRASVCGESVSGLRVVEVDSGQAEVSFKSAAFMPASGFLMYYKVQGCPVLSSTDGSSHLVEDSSNGSIAVFSCAEGYVFNDTQEQERTLGCVRDHHWNDTLPTCVPLDGTTTPTAIRNEVGSEKGLMLYDANVTQPTAERTTAEAKETAYLEDIIIPSALIAVLVVVNAIIVATILIIRKRNRGKMELEDEAFEDPRSEPLVADIKNV